MRSALRMSCIALLAIVIVAISVWAAFALWFRLPGGDVVKGAAAGLFAVIGLAAIVLLITGRHRIGLAMFAVAFGAVLLWWQGIEPAAQADWAPDVARQVTGTRNGDLLTLTNVRDFAWSDKADPVERWETRSYDLSKLRSADLFMSYWAGPEMAHVIMSFGFEGDDYLAWSIEVRRRKGGEFSPLADLFKSNPLVIVAADERDVVGVRSNVRGEDVQLYRLRMPPDAARTLLLEYVRDANRLSEHPSFYNSITTNCTTTVVKMMRAVGDTIPLDWRLIVNGYLPDYAYERGALDTRKTLPELRQAAHIDERAKTVGLTQDFSRLIRVGVPEPVRRDPAQQ